MDDNGPPASPPIRIVTRLLSEMQTSIAAAGIRYFDGNLDRFTIFTLIVRESALWPIGAGPQDRPRPISVYSLAMSLGRSFETVRRHVNAMIAGGLCERTPEGVVARADGLARPGAAGVLTVAHDSFVRLVEDMATLGIEMPPRRAGAAYDPPTGIRAAADIMLAVLDANMVLHREWVNLVLFSAIFCANSRRVTHDPTLTARHAHPSAPIPRALRVPVRSAVVARALGLSTSTTQRRVDAMLASGMLRRERQGLLVSDEWMDRPSAVAVSTGSYQNIRRILTRVASAGFPFDAPQRAYTDARPPAVAFA